MEGKGREGKGWGGKGKNEEREEGRDTEAR